MGEAAVVHDRDAALEPKVTGTRQRLSLCAGSTRQSVDHDNHLTDSMRVEPVRS